MTIFTAEQKRIMTMNRQELVAEGSPAAAYELSRMGYNAKGEWIGHLAADTEGRELKIAI